MRVLLATLVVVLALAPAARAADFTVNDTADTAGFCEGGLCTSIRAALGAAAQTPEADSISLVAGTYQLVDGALPIATNVTLRGPDASTTTIVAADGFRVLDITATATTAAVWHVTLRGGRATDFGGNLRNHGGTVSLDHVRITGGAAARGGGIANLNGRLTIENSLIDANAATVSGAGDAEDGSGGGIVNYSDGLVPANLTLRNSTVALNTAERRSGGIISYGGTQSSTTLSSVTLARNAAGAGGGGGIYVAPDSGTLAIGSSVVAANRGGNAPSDCAGTEATSAGWNVEARDECGFGEVSDRRNVGDVRMATVLEDGGGETDVLPPLVDSPAVNLKPGNCEATDQRDVTRPQGPACDAGALELKYAVRIDSGPPPASSATSAQFSFSTTEGNAFVCQLDRLGAPGTPAPCTSPFSYNGLMDGAYTFHVRTAGIPIGEATRQFTVDTVPTVTITSAPQSPTNQVSFPIEYTASESGVTFECTHTFPDDSQETIDCTSGWFPRDLQDGLHRFAVVAVDAAGNRSEPAERVIVVDTEESTPTPSPAPSATAVPSAPPTPTPELGERVVVRPVSGKVFVRLPGSSAFVELNRTTGIPVGAEIDARKGRIRLTAEPAQGKAAQRADFYGGSFRITQGSDGFVQLTLTEELAPCKKARAAAAKPKARKLWGDGKGKFRTKARYSSATVRGTKWLVQDSCDGTLTRVAVGIVSVRDAVKRKTFLVRAGRSYLAKPKR